MIVKTLSAQFDETIIFGVVVFFLLNFGIFTQILSHQQIMINGMLADVFCNFEVILFNLI